MKTAVLLSLWLGLLSAHNVHYQVEAQGIAIKAFYTADSPVSYSRYRIFAPEASLPHQEGRTDKNGYLAFVPDRMGSWKIEIDAGSEHGEHRMSFRIDVDDSMKVMSVEKPLFSTYSAILTGLGILFGCFGILMAYKCHHRLKDV